MVAVDIATDEGKKAICDAIPENEKLSFLIHNAAVGDPANVNKIDIDHFRYSMEVNVVAPLALSQSLFPRLQEKDGGRILHL